MSATPAREDDRPAAGESAAPAEGDGTAAVRPSGFRAEKYDPDNQGHGVLLIYTGGTIGSMPRDPEDLDSPRMAVSWDRFRRRTPALNRRLPSGNPNPAWIGFNVDAYWTEPRDSCNFGPREWTEIAQVIAHSYDRYEGFVILHGTDTMAYTAAALSFMLENLDKPVVLTGAQRSHLAHARNDATQNLVTALLIANPGFSNLPVVPEVGIFFSRKLLRGNRARKVNASGFEAYDSPNYPPLAVAGERIAVDPLLLRPRAGERALRVRTALETNVVPVSFFPGIQDTDLLATLLSNPRLRGVVLLTYGAGNIPSSERVLGPIREATSRGVVALAVTQCGGGRIELGMYETSVKLLDFGVVTGVDITAEAALAKLMVLLGDRDLSATEVARMAQQDLAGEQSLSVFVTEYADAESRSVSAAQPRARLSGRQVEGFVADPSALDQIVLRFHGARVATADGEPLPIGLHLDLERGAPALPEGDRWLGTFRRRPTEDAEAAAAGASGRTLYFDVTARARGRLGPRASLTVAIEKPGDPHACFSWERVALALFRRGAR